MGTPYQFYLILFGHYAAVTYIRKEKEFAFCRNDKDTKKVPEKKYL